MEEQRGIKRMYSKFVLTLRNFTAQEKKKFPSETPTDKYMNVIKKLTDEKN